MGALTPTSPTLLLVEDDSAHALLMREHLRGVVGRMETVHSRAQAERALSRASFDLAVVDLTLPDGSGFEIQEQLRLERDAPLLVFVTADERPESAVRALESGAAGYLIKRPGFPEALTRKIREVLRPDIAMQSVADESLERDVSERALALLHQFGKELFWIRAHAQRLERVVTSNQQAARSAQGIRELSESMSSSANELLDQRKGSESSSRQRQLSAVVDAAIRSVSRIHGRGRVITSLDSLASRSRVDGRLEGILVDLLDNALRASPPHVPVRIGSLPGERAGLQVIDAGIGMSAETLRRCCDLGFTTRSREGGKGIGLALSKRAVEGLAGELVIDSDLGSGTTITIWLPGIG